MDYRSLIRLDKSQLHDAAALFTRAFIDYPLFRHVVRAGRGRERRVLRLFMFLVRCGLKYGEVYAASQALDAAAVLFPDGKHGRSLWEMIRAGGLRLFPEVGPGALWRLFAFEEVATALHRRHGGMPHWYLQLLAVDPARQHHGLGGQLLAALTGHFESQGRACYLETQTADDLEFYLHRGFELRERVTVPGTKLTNWTLVRPAAAGRPK